MTEEFECEICKKKFDLEHSLNQHKNSKHGTSLPTAPSGKVTSHETNSKFEINISKKFIVLIVIAISLPAGFFIFNALDSSSTSYAVAYSPLKQHTSHDLGSADAPVTITEYGDFQCPFCRRFTLETEPLLKKNYIDTGKVRLIFKQFIGHPLTERTAEAAECADDQDKYWEYHDTLYEAQDAWQYNRGLDKQLVKYAEDLGLNSTLFKECLDSGIFEDVAKKENRQATTAGVSGTPTFIINGRRVVGAQPYHVFTQIIESELKA